MQSLLHLESQPEQAQRDPLWPQEILLQRLQQRLLHKIQSKRKYNTQISFNGNIILIESYEIA